tara:strand:+ start:2328 stop:2615 length:288 start_codon:yes stop_codon:yes gene_type:complete
MADLKDLKREIQRLADLTLGANRSPVFISGTEAVTIAQGYCIHFKEETIMSAITYDADTASATLVGETFVAGDRIFLKNISSVELTSGAVLIYKM